MIAKLNVEIGTLRPELLLLEPLVDETYHEFGMQAVVTSTNDGTHKKTSLHYRDAAFDLRVKPLDAAKQWELWRALRDKIYEKYPNYYDVLLEYCGLPNAHIHIELSPEGLKAAGLEG